MLIEYDTEAGAYYLSVAEGEVARTVHISDYVMVDVDNTGAALGVELLCQPDGVSKEERVKLEELFPALAASTGLTVASITH